MPRLSQLGLANQGWITASAVYIFTGHREITINAQLVGHAIYILQRDKQKFIQFSIEFYSFHCFARVNGPFLCCIAHHNPLNYCKTVSA